MKGAMSWPFLRLYILTLMFLVRMPYSMFSYPKRT